MNSLKLYFDRVARPGLRLCVALGPGVSLLVLAANASDACAATLSGEFTSVGLLSAFAALLVGLKGWPMHWGVGGLSTAGGMLALASGAALLWRFRGAVITPATSGVKSASASASALVPISVCGPASVPKIPGSAAVPLPEDVNCTLLLADLRQHFVQLQAAWDTAEREALSGLTTSDMLEDLCAGLPDCDAVPNHTEVVTLHARLLAFDDMASVQVVSVDFSGTIRESVDRDAIPFREVWMLTRSKDEGAGWRLARHQVLL